MPPRANTAVAGHPGDPQVSVDTYFGANGTGWFFAVARSVTSLWARANNCADAAPSPLDVSALLSGGVPASARLECVGWTRCSDISLHLPYISPTSPYISPDQVRRLDALLRRRARRGVHTRRGARAAAMAGGPVLELCARAMARAATACARPRRPIRRARAALPPESRACSRQGSRATRRWAKLKKRPRMADTVNDPYCALTTNIRGWAGRYK